MTHFANFPRPGENDPYMVSRLNISPGFQIISQIWLSILPLIVSRYFLHLIVQDVIGLSPGDRREVCLGEQDLDGEDGGAGKGG